MISASSWSVAIEMENIPVAMPAAAAEVPAAAAEEPAAAAEEPEQKPQEDVEKTEEEKKNEEKGTNEETEEQDKKEKNEQKPDEEQADPPAASPEKIIPQENENIPAAETEKNIDKEPEDDEEKEQAAQELFDQRVKEEVLSDDEGGLVLQDVRWCTQCKSKSYIRQGLCINLYCPLYFMNRPDANVRLTARGRLNEGKKWSPKEWVESGQWNAVEESLLSSEFQEACKEVSQYGPAPRTLAKVVSDIPQSDQPIVIEDLESGVTQEHHGMPQKPDDELVFPEQEAASGSKPDEGDKTMEDALKDLHLQNQILNASRQQRNKGWKRVQALGQRIAEKKFKGEWQGPEVPIPGFAQNFLKAPIQEVQKEWSKSNANWKK